MKETIQITTEYMTLGQFLKLADVIDSGGAAKIFLAENTVFVNGEPENRRGRKLYDGDQVEIPGIGQFLISR
ncbi:MAG TPA: S4 domain-containing protein YaaA [Bacillales bacterium]|nr:S4 domain-containing protein YaaA [Bacillales bacterium]